MPERHARCHRVPPAVGQEQLRREHRLDLIDQHVLVSTDFDDSEGNRAHLFRHGLREQVAHADGTCQNATNHGEPIRSHWLGTA